MSQEMRAALVELLDMCGPYADAKLSSPRMIAAVAAGRSAVAGASPDGPYRPELAEAFREGARELQIDRLHIDEGACVEESEGGAIVHCTVFVSDAERLPMPGEDAEV